MPKIIEEAEQIGTITLDDGRVVPHMKCGSEMLIINTKTGYEYSSEDHNETSPTYRNNVWVPSYPNYITLHYFLD